MQNNQKIPEGWSVKKLGECFSFLKTPSYSRAETTDSGLVHYIHYGDIHTKYPLHVSPTDIDIFISEDQAQKGDFLQTGDLILLDASEDYEGTTKCIELINVESHDKVISGLHTLALRDDANNFADGFRAYITSMPFVKDLFWKQVSGFKVYGVSKDNLKKIKILLPPLEEQEKIAGILGTWDEAIEKLSDLIEQKKLLKKGLMQKLIYTRTNATKYKVADLFELGRGRVISKNEIDTHQGVFPVYSSQTSDNGILGYINTYDFQGEYITWTTDGANAGEVFYRNGKFNCTNVCGTAKAKEKNVNLYYAMSFLNHVSKKYVSYVGNPKLMNGVFAIIPLILPDIEIQNKVAAILSTADDEINLLNQKLEAIKEQKKGLMQQLLTGQIRVKVN